MNIKKIVGVNLEQIVDWAAARVYIDIIHQGREWISVDPWPNLEGWDDGRPINLDSNGWVSSLEAPGLNGTENQQRVVSILSREVSSNYTPDEEWVCSWEGYGGTKWNRNVDLRNDAVVDRESWTYDSISNKGSFRFKINPSKAGITLQIGNIDGNWDNSNYPRNIKVYPLHLEDRLDEIFYPEFIDSLKEVEVIRSMPLTKTNFSPITDWNSRPLTTWYTRATNKGMPLEDVVSLANILKVDLAYSYPPFCENDYVVNATSYIRDNLDGMFYPEYGNEPWNGIFPISVLCKDKGLKLFNTGDSFQDTLMYYGYRSAEIFKTIELVFSNLDKVVRTINCQQGNTWIAKQILNTPFENGFVKDKVDALMIAPYFGGRHGHPDTASEVRDWTLDELFSSLDGPETEFNFSLKDAERNIVSYKQFADEEELRLLAYEGGHHLAGYNRALQEDEKLVNLFRSAIEDPRMGDLYYKYFNIWENHVDDIFFAFIHTGHHERWSMWGMREYQSQKREESPTLDGWLRWVEKKRVVEIPKKRVSVMRLLRNLWVKLRGRKGVR